MQTMQPKSNFQESGANGRGSPDLKASSYSANGTPPGAAYKSPGVLGEVEDLVKSTVSLTGENLASAKAKLGARVTAAKQSVEKFGGEISDRALNTAKATNTYVHAKPWQAIGAGAAVGLLVGFILARRD